MYLNLDYDLLEWHLLQPKVLLLLNIYARMCSAQSCPQTMPIIQHHESTAKHQNSTWKCTLAKNCTRIIHMYQLQNIKTFLRVKMYFGKKNGWQNLFLHISLNPDLKMLIIKKKEQFEENKIGLAMKNLLREINCRSLGIFAAKPSSEIWHNKAKNI